jgi:hypothetical protein
MAEVRQASTEILGDWRQSQQKRAIKAVDAGLDASDDPYKRATIGVSVLKGLGVYSDGGSTVTTNIYVNTQDLPKDWYESNECISGDVRDVTPEESKG